MKIFKSILGLVLTTRFINFNNKIVHHIHLDLKDQQIQTFIDDLINNHNFSREYVTSSLKKIIINRNTIRIMDRPAGKIKSWPEYRDLFLTSFHINGGKRFIKNNKIALMKAQQEYGVPINVITAIIGIETRYGAYIGKDKILYSLATLAFNYPRRRKYFTKQLKDFFILTRKYNLDIFKLEGSYAGAIGIAQFMPESYLKYAVDFNSDKRVDLFNVKDAIGSVANYLNNHGWQKNQPIIKNTTTLNLNLKNITGKIINFEGDKVEIYKNFGVIKRYNYNNRYAMCVYLLSDIIGV
jgi:membrane-bound lytic murein transglycosylase B